MSVSWNGLYAKASVEGIVTSLSQLASSKGYRVPVGDRALTCSRVIEIAQNFEDDLSGNLKKGLDSVFVLPPINGWSCILGMAELNLPKLMVGGELVQLLGCDAVDCGFYDSTSWWYDLYLGGLVIDRYDSNPEESYNERTYLGSLDPTDPREIHRQSLDAPVEYVRFPPDVLSAYRGDSKRVAAVFHNSEREENEVETILRRTEVHPETAFLRFCAELSLPHADKTSCEHLFMLLTRLAHNHPAQPPDPDLLKWMEEGLAMIVLGHAAGD